MTSHRAISFAMAVILIFCFSGIAVAEGEQDPDPAAEKGLQVSIFKPYQLHNPDVSINGFRWNVFYGVNKNVSGLDVGIVNIATGTFKGLQIGLYNDVETSSGLQLGVMNTARNASGVQIGIFNHSDQMKGLQIGMIYNSSDTLDGTQIGLLNFHWNQKPLFCLPLVNGSF